ncbi:MAG: hypothetical protein Q8M70_00035 [bacterium]|nr:hypothetical protein [bacterium]
MKKNDLCFILGFLGISLIFLLPSSRGFVIDATNEFPYLMGFLKTSILASMGELLADRIKHSKYFARPGFGLRFLIWGLLGMAFVLAFKVFSSGVQGAQLAGLLPQFFTSSWLGTVWTAFLISLIMNLIFAPTFMILHRITDGYIDLSGGCPRCVKGISLSSVIDRIDWNRFFGFVVLKTIPFFWIPAHTITFLLPEHFRVLMAGYLSIALGLILSLSNKKKEIKKVD